MRLGALLDGREQPVKIMETGKPSEFFLTGLGVAWPLMLWAGTYEIAVIMFIFLVAAIIVCQVCEQDGDDTDSGGGTGGGPREPERRLVSIRHDDTRDR